ncbi:MAG: PilZ domain-containing protein [Nitrosomonadales bacterium]|nr:PilZ domain-containing protein [Nitrosomonadales bacterium]
MKNYKGGAATDTPEHRRATRHPVHWRVAIVRKTGDKNEIFHGRTHDVSTRGASILADENIFVEDSIVMLLAIPPRHTGLPENIIEIRSRMLYTVLSADHGMFRIGIKFLEFKGEGKSALTDILSQMVVPEDQRTFRVE